MSNTNLIPSTQSKLLNFWGNFWGTMNTMTKQAETAWSLAMTAIANATGQPLESVQAYLDSSHGRVFALSVIKRMDAGQSLADAIDAVVNQWMGWIFDSEPCLIPYLTGRVIYEKNIHERMFKQWVSNADKSRESNNVKSISVVCLNKGGWAVRERRRDGVDLFVYASSTPGGYTMHQASAAADSLRRHLAGGCESYAEPLPEGVRVVKS